MALGFEFLLSPVIFLLWVSISLIWLNLFDSFPLEHVVVKKYFRTLILFFRERLYFIKQNIYGEDYFFHSQHSLVYL